MVSKPKPAQPPNEAGSTASTTTAAPTPPTTTSTAAAPAATPAVSSPAVTPAVEVPAANPVPEVQAPVDPYRPVKMVSDEEYESSCATLRSMGFADEKVKEAMLLSYENISRASDLLCDPAQMEAEKRRRLAEQAVAAAPPAAPEGGVTAPAGGVAAPDIAAQPGAEQAIGDRFAILRNRPEIQRVREVLRQHPEQLPAIIHEIGQQNPDLLSLIRQNPQEFVSLLQDEVPPPDRGEGTVTVSLLPNERDEVKRIVEIMACDESDALQAYMACDKNMQNAINLLCQDDDNQ